MAEFCRDGVGAFGQKSFTIENIPSFAFNRPGDHAAVIIALESLKGHLSNVRIRAKGQTLQRVLRLYNLEAPALSGRGESPGCFGRTVTDRGQALPPCLGLSDTFT